MKTLLNREVLERFTSLIVVAAFDIAAATAYGEVRALLERHGTPIGSCQRYASRNG